MNNFQRSDARNFTNFFCNPLKDHYCQGIQNRQLVAKKKKNEARKWVNMAALIANQYGTDKILIVAGTNR